METKNLLQLNEESMGGDVAIPYEGSASPETDYTGNIFAIDAYTDTVIDTVTSELAEASEWNGKTIPAGKTLLLRCTKITFSSGTGAIYKRL